MQAGRPHLEFLALVYSEKLAIMSKNHCEVKVILLKLNWDTKLRTIVSSQMVGLPKTTETLGRILEIWFLC